MGEDEEDIVVGDIATITASLLRKNLKEGEAMGPVHAPLFPEPKFEEWWLFLVEGAPTMRIIGFERIRDTERVVEEKLRFQVSRLGKHQLTLHALSDSYSGIDQKVELNFNVLQESALRSDYVVHREDAELDLQPTLFQQFMGELNRDEDSDEEEEEDTKAKKKTPAKKDLKAEKDDADDSDDDKTDKKKGAKDSDDD